MVGKRRPRKPRITDEQINEMMRLRRQGKSISAIAQATGCHRQTVRGYLRERRGDILADEVRKQVLIDELRRHLDDLAQFAASLAHRLPVHNSPNVKRDVEAVFAPLWGKERQAIRRNKMLFESLREHTGEKGWWQAFKEWEQAWDACNRALEELQGEAYEVVHNLINQKAGLKEEVERQSSKERDAMGMTVDDVLWTVWRASTSDRPVKDPNFRIEDNQVVVDTGSRTYYTFRHKLSEASLGPDMVGVCKLSFETLYQSFSDKGICEMLDTMKKKIEEIDGSLDPFILRPQILRTRCELCPA